jgi:histidinol-phosphate aminotransferase
LIGIGLPPAVSEANFIWLRLGELTMDFAATCDRAGLSVRPFAGEGVRVTIGEPDANSRFLALCADWVARGA